MKKSIHYFRIFFMIIPPFRDCHIHFVINGKEVSRDGIISIGKKLLSHGIFEVWEMGFKNASGFLAREILKDFINVKVAGVALYKKGFYGSFLGRGITRMDEVEEVVKEISKKGADFLKVLNSGVIDPRFNNMLSNGGFSFEELRFICSFAREKNLKVICHANGRRAIEEAIMAGVSSIEHGYFITEDLIQLMKERRVSWTPTLFALLAFSRNLSDSEQQVIERILRHHMDLINYANSIGVKINIGTDSGARGVEHGRAFFEELRLLRKAGLSLKEIISITCMPEDEVTKGNYLIIDEDFIETGKLRAIYFKGKESLVMHD
ncbi:MAG: amidohydrolase family protein [Thermodesulfovibrionales bacterium]|nr:amidohydrolase family protein [Thermodesulfovibrionales bacterium]